MRKRVLCSLLALCLLLGACGKRQDLSLRENELLAVGDIVCTWPEAQIYILSQYTRYTSSYGSGIWKVELADGTFEQYIRDGLLDYLELLFLADCGARRAGVTLSNAERSSVAHAAEAYMQQLGEEGRAATGITREVAEEAFARFARAQIFYRQTMIDGHVEISDEEARVISLQIVEIEHRAGYAEALRIQTELEKGTQIGEILRGVDGVSVRKENVVRGTYGEEWETVAFALKEGRWSPIISQDTSYYLIQCLSPYVVEETARHKAEMEKSLREENLNSALKELADTVQLIYNPDRWNKWSMQQFGKLPPVNFYDYTAELIK